MIFGPLRFLQVRHAFLSFSTKKYTASQNKLIYDAVIPGFAALVFGLATLCPVFDLHIIGEGGFVEHILDLMRLLVGFYVAGVGAVSSLGRSEVTAQPSPGADPSPPVPASVTQEVRPWRDARSEARTTHRAA